MTAVPACWALYGKVLAREYSDPAYFAVHQLTVDAYATQHPGGENAQARQSVVVHLVTLCAHFERQWSGHDLIATRKNLSRRKTFPHLSAPSEYPLTVQQVHQAQNAEEHARLVTDWAAGVWHAWSHAHERIRGILDNGPSSEQ